MPIVPKLEPVAKEMTYDRIEVDACRAQAGRPPDVSAPREGFGPGRRDDAARPTPAPAR